jgi:cytochrome P450
MEAQTVAWAAESLEEPQAGTRGALARFVGRLYAEARSGAQGLRPFGRMWLADQPEGVEAVCKAPEIFNKDYSYVQALGRSRFSTDGGEWTARREITQPYYVEAVRPANRAEIAARYAEQLGACDCSDPTRLRDAILAVSLGVFHRALGADIAAEDSVALANHMRDAARELQAISLFGAPPETRAAAVEKAKEVGAGVLARASEGTPLRELLDRFAAGGGAVAQFSPAEEYMMNLFAGVETSVAAISWVIDRLGLYQELQEEMRAEACSGADDCPLVEAFINETMRCYPPIPVLVRRTVRATGLSGKSLAAGQHVLVSLVGLHRNPRCWRESQSFDPRRSEFRDGSYDRRAFLPFSTGARVCGGARLARMEVSEGTKVFLRRFHVRREPVPIRLDFALAMRPDNWEALTLRPKP